MERLTEKLTQAAGVAGRAVADLEARADALIAREGVVKDRSAKVFLGPHAVLDAAEKGLDAVEAGQALIANAPLDGSQKPPG